MNSRRFPLPLLVGLLGTCLALSGCTSGEMQSDEPASADAKTRTLLAVAAFGSGGSLVDEMMRRNAYPMLESARGRGVPDEAINELDRVFRNFFEQLITAAVVPVYTKAFNEQELDEMIAFFSTPAGEKFNQLLSSRTTTKVETVLANAGPHRTAIETFLKTPTGRDFTAKSQGLSKEVENELNKRMISQQTELARRIQMIRDRYKF